MPMPKTNLEAKLAALSEHWSPKVVGAFNGHDVMVVKAKGEFVWHSHPDTDDLFLVLKGRLTIPRGRHGGRPPRARAASPSRRHPSGRVHGTGA